MMHDATEKLPVTEHDEFHSALEFDDSVGWRVFIVPVALFLFVVGGLLFLFLY